MEGKDKHNATILDNVSEEEQKIIDILKGTDQISFDYNADLERWILRFILCNNEIIGFIIKVEVSHSFWLREGYGLKIPGLTTILNFIKMLDNAGDYVAIMTYNNLITGAYK